MKKLFLAFCLTACVSQPVYCHLTPQEQIEIVKSPEFKMVLAKCIELLKTMGNSCVIIIQQILKEAGPKVAEALKPILRAMGYPI